VPDVFWLSFFGPAFLERWGTARFDGLGVRYDDHGRFVAGG
jgi:hypothetical protein